MREHLCHALAKTMAENFLLSEARADNAACEALLNLLRAMCRAALDPGLSDAAARETLRKLCGDALIFFREQGL